MPKLHHRLLTLLALILLPASAAAEQMRVFGNYEVHYIVFNATFLSPDVAQAYNITRGRDRAVVNIAVRKRVGDGETRPQRAIITGSSSDLIHRAPLEFTEHSERDAIYYVAELRFNNDEKRDFRIRIQPDPDRDPYELNFSQTLYTN